MNKQIDITDVVLTTDRLTLRPWRESDLNDFYEYASVDGVGQMAGWNPHRNVEESRMIMGRRCLPRNSPTMRLNTLLCRVDVSRSR